MMHCNEMQSQESIFPDGTRYEYVVNSIIHLVLKTKLKIIHIKKNPDNEKIHTAGTVLKLYVADLDLLF